MPDIYLYTVPSDGTADVRLRDPTVAAGAGSITGTLAATEAQDAAVFAGLLEYAGTLAAVEGQDAASFAGAQVYSGSLAAVEGQDAAAFAGSLVYSGDLSAAEGQDAAAFSGVLVYSGAIAAVEGQDTAAFDGAVVGSAVTGDLAAVEGQDVATFDGANGVQSLHGRRIRGRRIVFPDELDPFIPPPAPERIVLPTLETARASVAEATRALDGLRADRIAAIERKARSEALTELNERYDAALAGLRMAEEAERAIVRRLRDEDELFLLAA